MRVPQPLAAYGLRREHLERRLYLRDEHGRIVSGFRAVLALWARLPGYRRLARVFSWPPLRAVCESIYDHAIAPGLAYWARVRQVKESQAHERIFRPHHRHRDFPRAQQRHGVRDSISPLRKLLEAVCPLGIHGGVLDARRGDGDLSCCRCGWCWCSACPACATSTTASGRDRAARAGRGLLLRWSASSSPPGFGSPACARPSANDYPPPVR